MLLIFSHIYRLRSHSLLLSPQPTKRTPGSIADTLEQSPNANYTDEMSTPITLLFVGRIPDIQAMVKYAKLHMPISRITAKPNGAIHTSD